MKKRYRITYNIFRGYVPQVKYSLFPFFWFEIGMLFYYDSEDKAMHIIQRHKYIRTIINE